MRGTRVAATRPEQLEGCKFQSLPNLAGEPALAVVRVFDAANRYCNDAILLHSNMTWS